MNQLQQAIRILTNAMQPDSLPDAERQRFDLEGDLKQVQRSLHVFSAAMRGEPEPERPDAHGDPDATEREVSSNNVPRPMGYFSQKSAKTPQQRAVNSSDGPLVPRAILLAPPDQKRQVRK